MISVQLINLISVGIFGIILSAVFCDIHWTGKKRLTMLSGIAAILLLQGVVYFRINPDIVEELYPLITHIPLIVLLCILNRKCL